MVHAVNAHEIFMFFRDDYCFAEYNFKFKSCFLKQLFWNFTFFFRILRNFFCKYSQLVLPYFKYRSILFYLFLSLCFFFVHFHYICYFFSNAIFKFLQHNLLFSKLFLFFLVLINLL
jgi:hypothetical protein